MNKYDIGGIEVLVIDGALYRRIQSQDDSPANQPETVAPKRRGRKPGDGAKGLNAQIVEHRERKARKVLGPEAEEAIVEEIKGGAGLAEICKKYEISVSTFYRLKGESRSKPVLEN